METKTTEELQKKTNESHVQEKLPHQQEPTEAKKVPATGDYSIIVEDLRPYYSGPDAWMKAKRAGLV